MSVLRIKGMYNLRETNGTFKGIIGECMFKLTRDKAVLTKFFNKEKYSRVFEKHFNHEQLDFLKDNWYSLDAIEIKYSEEKKELILYEIKTKNKYHKDLSFKQKITLSTVKLYELAKEKDFAVKNVNVVLHENWEYELKISDFNQDDYCIDKPKTYDKKMFTGEG